MRNTAPSRATVQLIRARDLHACARCGVVRPWATTQHRVARGMGGTRHASVNQPQNLVTLCGSGTTGCHGQVEANPAWAKAHGWSVAWWDNPATVPVWTWRGWLLLLASGEVEHLTDYAGVPGCSCGCDRDATPAGLWDRPEISSTRET